MDIKQILLVQPAEGPGEAAASVAGQLARRHGALVAGLCLYIDPVPDPAECFAEGAQAIGEVLDHQRERVKALTAPAERVFQEILADRGCSDGWRVGEVDEWRETVIQQARLVDLVVLGAPGRDKSYRTLVEELALSSGTPCLLVPAGATAKEQPARVVLAWNGSREAKRALDDGLELLKAAGKVAVVVVQEESTRWIALAQTDALARHLARHGVQAEIILASGAGRPAGTVLAAQCEAFGADLLIMGAFGRSRAAEMLLGGATRAILANAKLPTLLSH